jgi:hypothetical protein
MTETGDTSNTVKNSSPRSFFWPLLLIILGTLFLLNNFSLLPWSIWNSLLKFWPILLIFIGLEILLGRSKIANLLMTTIGLVIVGTILILTIPDLVLLAQQLLSGIRSFFSYLK